MILLYNNRKLPLVISIHKFFSYLWQKQEPFLDIKCIDNNYIFKVIYQIFISKMQGGDNTTLKKKERSYKKYTVNFDEPVSSSLHSLEAAKKYLDDHIKVNGVKKNLGESVKISVMDKKEKQKNTILVQADTKMKFSKRYIKYLVKKFLKRENIASYLRVISSTSNSYTVRVFNRNQE